MQRRTILTTFTRRPAWQQGLIGAALAAVLCACSPSSTPDPTAIIGKFDIGSRALYLECHGSGTPTIVMDAGLGNTHATWQAVAQAVSPLARTCTYDRANLGSSDAAPKPRSSADIVADLHALLKSAAVAPPYLLVGHSLGGMDVRLFASDYPAEVAGMVLVDPTPTTFVDEECAIVTPSVCAKLRADWSHNPEGIDNVKNGQEIAAAGPLPGVPLIVLAATNHQQAAITDPAIEKQVETLWQQDEGKLAASVSGGMVDVVSSGHDIQTLHPDAVIAALKSVLPAVNASP